MFGGIRFCSAVPNASKTHHYLTYIGLGDECLNENTRFCCVCVLRRKKKQLIIEFNRRNTVYPVRHEASEKALER